MSFLEFDFVKFRAWMEPHFVCLVLLRAAQPWMYRTRIPMEAAGVTHVAGVGSGTFWNVPGGSPAWGHLSVQGRATEGDSQ